MSRILLVTPRFPYPSLSGGEKWAAKVAEGLAQKHEVSLFSFTVPGAETHQTALAMSLEGRLFKKVFLLPKPAAPAPGLPSLPAMYWSPEAAAALDAATRQTHAQLVHILFSEMACYQAAVHTSLPVVYTEIDSSYLYPWKYYLRETAGLKGFLKAGEFFGSRNYARSHYGRFAAASFITEADGRNISSYLACGATAVTPNAVSPEEFARPAGEAKGSGIVFLGHYPHYPNEDAALRLARRILPLVRSEAPAASLTLAGSCPTPPVTALQCGHISVPGTAADIRPFLWGSSVFAAPVRYGLGTKGKILEAFAAGLPVVASREAAAGVEGAQPGRHLLVGGSDRDFAAKLAALLRDAALRERLSGEALRLVRERFSFSGVVDSVSALYGRVLGA